MTKLDDNLISNNNTKHISINMEDLKKLYISKSGLNANKAFEPQNELCLKEDIVDTSKSLSKQNNNIKIEDNSDNQNDNNLLGKKRENNNDLNASNSKNIIKEENNNELEIPNEILLLAKNYSNYDITLNIFNKYRFYKKYCEVVNNSVIIKEEDLVTQAI